MRLIFVDEAGTSATEPVTVVLALIADADRHIVAAETAISEAFKKVPPQFSNGFAFHATAVYSDRRLREGWSREDRLAFLLEMMSIPRRVGMVHVVGAHWRGSIDYTKHKAVSLQPSQMDHLTAFSLCMAQVDLWIRTWAGPNEMGVIVGEDVPEMRRFLRQVPKMLRDSPVTLTAEQQQISPVYLESGRLPPPKEIKAERIRNPAHFVEKQEDPILQLVDACAFGIRRYFAKQADGIEFARAILGDETRLRNFAPPGGAEVLWPLGI